MGAIRVLVDVPALAAAHATGHPLLQPSAVQLLLLKPALTLNPQGLLNPNPNLNPNKRERCCELESVKCNPGVQAGVSAGVTVMRM